MNYNVNNLNQMGHNPDNVYYDMVFRNFNSSQFESALPLNFQEVRNHPILNKASDYEMSIVRFMIDTHSLPIFIPDIKRDQGNYNLTIYTITFEYDDGSGSLTSSVRDVIFIPDDKAQPPPPPPNANPYGLQSDTLYYYLYSYESFIRMINTALNEAMDDIITFHPALTGVESPFLCWNPETQTADLYCRLSHFDESIIPSLLTPKINIYINRPLFSYFNSFPHEKYIYNNFDNKHYRIVCDSCNGIRAKTYGVGVDLLIKVQQEYSTTPTICPVSSILFTTSSMPIVPNLLSVPQLFDDGRQIQLSNTNDNYSNIITDIQSLDNGYRSTLLYLPSASYRFVSLTNDAPLKQIDISVAWSDKTGRIKPLFLPPNTSCSMKILFRKKY